MEGVWRGLIPCPFVTIYGHVTTGRHDEDCFVFQLTFIVHAFDPDKTAPLKSDLTDNKT